MANSGEDPDSGAEPRRRKRPAEHDDELDLALAELQDITFKLKRASLRIVGGTVLGVFAVVAEGITVLSRHPLLELPTVTIALIVLVCAFVFLQLFEFDRESRVGRALYGDISNELQVRLRNSVSSGSESLPPLKVRRTLSSFEINAHLPMSGSRRLGFLLFITVNAYVLAGAVALLVFTNKSV